jgi:hypothetical protein
VREGKLTKEQLHPVIGISLFGNALEFGLRMAPINAEIDKVDTGLGSLRAEMNERFNGVNDRFASINQRFDDMRDLWRPSCAA